MLSMSTSGAAFLQQTSGWQRVAGCMVALYYQSSSSMLRTHPVLAELVGCLYVLVFGI